MAEVGVTEASEYVEETTVEASEPVEEKDDASSDTAAEAEESVEKTTVDIITNIMSSLEISKKEHPEKTEMLDNLFKVMHKELSMFKETGEISPMPVDKNALEEAEKASWKETCDLAKVFKEINGRDYREGDQVRVRWMKLTSPTMVKKTKTDKMPYPLIEQMKLAKEKGWKFETKGQTISFFIPTIPLSGIPWCEGNLIVTLTEQHAREIAKITEMVKNEEEQEKTEDSAGVECVSEE